MALASTQEGAPPQKSAKQRLNHLSRPRAISFHLANLNQSTIQKTMNLHKTQETQQPLTDKHRFSIQSKYNVLQQCTDSSTYQLTRNTCSSR